MKNALTVDVEDYYQVSGFERDIRRDDWDSYPSRVVQNTRRVLQILDQYKTQATFFVMGWVADRHPELVAEIDRCGHEVGSHSYWHRLVYDLTPGEFREDLRRSRDSLENILGKQVNAYRAPSFSIVKQSLWALDILAEEGFTVDSSVFPIHHDRCGIPDAPRHPYQYHTVASSVWEFPASVARIGKVNVPVSGGGYFRLLPYGVCSRLLDRVNRVSKLPFVFYIHPWELDPEQPILKVGSRAMRFRHYVNLATTEAKFKKLLSDFAFARMDEVLSEYSQRRDSACNDFQSLEAVSY